MADERAPPWLSENHAGSFTWQWEPFHREASWSESGWRFGYHGWSSWSSLQGAGGSSWNRCWWDSKKPEEQSGADDRDDVDEEVTSRSLSMQEKFARGSDLPDEWAYENDDQSSKHLSPFKDMLNIAKTTMFNLH